jgi:LuxR family maltose regulon positive regulatory protein
MATPLLSTKLYIPQVRLFVIPRLHLIRRLNESLDSKLTLVSAPAGFGKTTLIAEWAHGCDMLVAWVSLDERDNVKTRFLTYLTSAFQQHDPDIGAEVITVMQAAEDSQIEPLLTILINQIAQNKNEFVLVFDDYHLITSKSIHQAVEFLIEYLPPNLHLVLIGRADPPFSLSRLRASSLLAEFRSKDLRFTKEEIASFLNNRMGFNLTDEDIKALEARTEGWIASLQLAALSLKGREDKEGFITAFSGSHRHVIDYLVDEVMSHQPDELQYFLLHTSILDRFCTSLCNSILEINNSKDIIAHLEEANLFVVPLDDERIWYRYHHLFADFLQQRLRERYPGIIAELHHRTSVWFQENELIPEAINHSLVGEDFERAAYLVENFGPEMMMHSEFDLLEEWLDAIPKEVVKNWPWLCIIRAWMFDRLGQFDLGEQYLQSAESALGTNASSKPGEAEKIIRGQIAAIRALYAIKKGEIPQSIAHSNQALDNLPEGYFNRGMASYTLGWAKCVQGDLSGALQKFQEGHKDSLVAGNLHLAQMITLDIAITYILQGHLHQAVETLHEVIEFKYENSEIRRPYAANALVILADILREWNELDSALTHLEEGIEIGKSAKLMDVVVVGYASLAKVFLAQGNLEKAIQMWEKVERMVSEIPDLEPDTKTKTIDNRVRLLLAQDKITEAARYAQEQGFTADTKINYFAEFRHIIFARVLTHIGRKNSDAQALQDANRILVRILKFAKPAGYISQIIEALALQAIVYEAQGRRDKALSSLEEALSLAEPEGFIRTFIDEGPPMARLLYEASNRKIAPKYTSRLLATFPDLKQAVVSQKQTVEMVEPLSEREVEVLHLIAEGSSNHEVSQRLFITLATVKWHTSNIYGKLGVKNRTQAIAQARALGILPND